VRLVLSRAAEWGIDPKRIGMVGFPAGGHLATATVAGFGRRGKGVCRGKGGLTPLGGRRNALHIVKKRAQAAGLTHKLCNHTFRATGITAYNAGGGSVDKARQMAAHARMKATELYNRTGDEITLDEVERIAI
jgi:acetyl esterase/lipase